MGPLSLFELYRTLVCKMYSQSCFGLLSQGSGCKSNRSAQTEMTPRLSSPITFRTIPEKRGPWSLSTAIRAELTSLAREPPFPRAVSLFYNNFSVTVNVPRQQKAARPLLDRVHRSIMVRSRNLSNRLIVNSVRTHYLLTVSRRFLRPYFAVGRLGPSLSS